MSKEYTGMKVLELDIETAPHKVYAWGLFKENIYIDRVIDPGYTLCWAANWQHEPLKDVQFSSLWGDGEELMIERIWMLLDEADVVVHYNGKRFDIPTLNREFVRLGFTPPSPYKQIDLYQVVRSSFRFASNKLDFVSQALELGAKVQHKGMEMWKDIMDALDADEWTVQQVKSMKTMEKYNKEDVNLLRRLYLKLQPWIRVHPNRALWMEDPSVRVCPKCGSKKVQKRGIERPANVMAYQRYKCMDCGANSRSRASIKGIAKPELA